MSVASSSPDFQTGIFAPRTGVQLKVNSERHHIFVSDPSIVVTVAHMSARRLFTSARSSAAPACLRSTRNVRYNSMKPQYQAPSPTPSSPSEQPAINPHVSFRLFHPVLLILYWPGAQRAFYKSWGLPLAKVFLGAMFTYQVLYYGWLKLESIEQKKEKDGGWAYFTYLMVIILMDLAEEMKLLEGKLAELTASKANKK